MKLDNLKRICTDFNDELSLRILYTSLFRPKLEYASLIWHLSSVFQTQSISTVQNNFFIFLCYKCCY